MYCEIYSCNWPFGVFFSISTSVLKQNKTYKNAFSDSKSLNIVTYLLKARIAEPEEMAPARQWLCNDASAAIIHLHNNRWTVGGRVLCWVCAKAMCWEPKLIVSTWERQADKSEVSASQQKWVVTCGGQMQLSNIQKLQPWEAMGQ
jgi:hypothetical protein